MKKLLSLDLPQIAVANALGCSDSLISQYMSDPNFLAEVSALKLARLEGASLRDEKLDTIEGKVIDKLMKSVDYLLKPQDLINALKTISAVPRKTVVNGNLQQTNLGQTVNITLPNVTAITFIKNANGEIIEAGGRSLSTLSAAGLKRLALPNQQEQSLLQIPGVSNDRQTQFPRFRRETEPIEVSETNSSTAVRQTEAKVA